MQLKVLGSSGAEFPGYNSPAFLIDGSLLLDAGTIGTKLDETEQCDIKNILVTHSHLDHIKGIPFLADNMIIKSKMHSVNIFGVRETISSLKKNLLNNMIWPDFTKISVAIEPVLKLKHISVNKPFSLDTYQITAYRVNHTVPAVGYIVKDKNGRTLLYTGDTGPTEEIWRTIEKINTAIIEVSFPNRLEELALKTGHLTAGLFLKELKKLSYPPERVLITHPKPQYLTQIIKEIGKIKNRNIEMLQDGKEYEI